MHHRVVVLGATGSIGRSTLAVIANLQRQGVDVQVTGLSASTSVERAVEQARQTKAPLLCMTDRGAAAAAADALAGSGTRVLSGAAGLVELVEQAEADLVVAGIVGAAGLPAVVAAARRGVDIGLANKETLVVAGSLIVPLCRATGAALLPIDSEHSAIFQSLQSGTVKEIRRIILTASGGPFRTWSRERIAKATLADALNHPTWNMGPKITIDSATMFNKALEIIEACRLFSVPASCVQVVVHPQSIFHSGVEFVDGSLMAQLGTPDMCTPIQYVITYPQRLDGVAKYLDFTQLSSLNFELPDEERFPALQLARQAADAGGVAGAVLNAANEEANSLFREGRIGFMQITDSVAAALAAMDAGPAEVTLEGLVAADEAARAFVRTRLGV